MKLVFTMITILSIFSAEAYEFARISKIMDGNKIEISREESFRGPKLHLTYEGREVGYFWVSNEEGKDGDIARLQAQMKNQDVVFDYNNNNIGAAIDKVIILSK